jgi:hypothetical protein
MPCPIKTKKFRYGYHVKLLYMIKRMKKINMQCPSAISGVVSGPMVLRKLWTR